MIEIKSSQVNNLTFLQYLGNDFSTVWGAFISDLAANYGTQYLQGYSISSYWDAIGAESKILIGASVSKVIIE